MPHNQGKTPSDVLRKSGEKLALRLGHGIPGESKRRQSLADIAYAQLEEWIGTRHIPPGVMLSEQQLAEELGMGRTPVREALQRLRQIGYVEMHPRRGTLIAASDVRQQLDLLEVRRPLEECMVRLAALRAKPAQRDHVRQLAQDILAASAQGDLPGYFRSNKEIHFAQAQATHNQAIIKLMEAVHAQSRRFWYEHIETQRAFAQAARLHAAVLTSIADQDVSAATRHVQALMDFLEQLTRSTLETPDCTR